MGPLEFPVIRLDEVMSHEETVQSPQAAEKARLQGLHAGRADGVEPHGHETRRHREEREEEPQVGARPSLKSQRGILGLLFVAVHEEREAQVAEAVMPVEDVEEDLASL